MKLIKSLTQSHYNVLSWAVVLLALSAPIIVNYLYDSEINAPEDCGRLLGSFIIIYVVFFLLTKNKTSEIKSRIFLGVSMIFLIYSLTRTLSELSGEKNLKNMVRNVIDTLEQKTTYKSNNSLALQELSKMSQPKDADFSMLLDEVMSAVTIHQDELNKIYEEITNSNIHILFSSAIFEDQNMHKNCSDMLDTLQKLFLERDKIIQERCIAVDKVFEESKVSKELKDRMLKGYIPSKEESLKNFQKLREIQAEIVENGRTMLEFIKKNRKKAIINNNNLSFENSKLLDEYKEIVRKIHNNAIAEEKALETISLKSKQGINSLKALAK